MADQPEKPVGYKSPPKHSQFRKGGPQPKRRSKKGDTVDVHAILSEPVRVGEGGAAQKLHPFELALLQMAQAAIKGDMRAAELLMHEFEKYGLVDRPVEEPGICQHLVIPVDYDPDEWHRNLELFGPPPWPLEHDGLPRIQELRNAVRG